MPGFYELMLALGLLFCEIEEIKQQHCEREKTEVTS